MKNRVLRLALAMILVFSLVLTMVACGGEDVKPSPTPSTAPTAPVAPTDQPVVDPTVTPTKKPSVADPQAEEFGFKLEATDGVYGTKLEDKDGNEVENQFGKFVFSYDTAKTADEQYATVVKVGDELIYSDYLNGSTGFFDEEGTAIATSATNIADGFFLEGSAAVVNADDLATGTVAGGSLSYDGEDSNLPATLKTTIDTKEKTITIDLPVSGEYEAVVTVYLIDRYTDFGAWDNTEKEGLEFELSAVASVAKKEMTFSPDAIVVPEMDKELRVDGATGTVYYENGNGASNTTDGDYDAGADKTKNDISYSVFPSISTGDLDTLNKDEVGYNATPASDTSAWKAMKYEVGYTEKGEVGTYEVTVKFMDGTSATAEALDVADLEFKNHVLTVENTSINVVSEYDWNEIRDVVTTVAEIKHEIYNGTATATKAGYKTKFAVADANYTTQAPLARARYDALSAEQQAFFKTGLVAQFGTDADIKNAAPTDATTASGGYINLWKALEVAATDVTAIPDTAVVVITDASVFFKYLEAAEEAAAEAEVVKAFNKVADDANLSENTWADTVTSGAIVNTVVFNAENGAHETAFETVYSYFQGLSDDDKKVIETAGGKAYFDIAAPGNTEAKAVNDIVKTGNRYPDYFVATEAFGAEEVNKVTELIAGAYNSYAQALLNGAKVIYQDGITAGTTPSAAANGEIHAWAYINNSELKSLTAQAQSAYDALTDDQKEDLNLTVSDSDSKIDTIDDGTNVIVDFDTNVTYVQILDQLTSMNESVGRMLEVIDYVNIDDYSDSDLAFDRLNALVYGNGTQGFFGDAAVFGMKANTTATTENTRFAMDDIANAAPRKHADIVAEYKAWIDYIIAIETQKEAVISEIQTMIAENVTLEEYEEEKGAAAVSGALSTADGSKFDDLKKAIMAEVSEKGGSDLFYTGTTKFTIANFTFELMNTNGDIESVEGAMETLEDKISASDLFDEFLIYCGLEAA